MDLYILIKHKNTIEHDDVDVLSVSESLERILLAMDKEHDRLKEQFRCVENCYYYKRYVDEHNEMLIELTVFNKGLT